MANSKIFCNVPWAKVFIRSTGHYAPCCIMTEDLSGPTIEELTPIEWFHSDRANRVRSRMLDNQSVKECSKCYYNENIGYESGRIRDNYKSFIFPGEQFERSYVQSPWHKEFEHSRHHNGQTVFDPVEYTVSLGNECNLACKMCNPTWSSRIADKYQTWNILSPDLDVRNNWTANDQSWNKFLTVLKHSDNLVRLIFLGGETTMNKRFHEIIDFLVDHNRTNIVLHFITNATLYNQNLINKLKKFKEIYIEFSIESIEDNNHYIRQGSNTQQVIENILKIKTQLESNAIFTISSAPQALSINNYSKLIRWALSHNIPIQGHVVTNPNFLNVTTLPVDLRRQLLPQYQQLEQELKEQVAQEVDSIAFGSDPSKISQVLLNETQSMIKLLQAPDPANAKQLQTDMINWMIRWDQEFNLDAREYFPEYKNWLDQMNYHV
jgi:pyruvate-formate lyase-activating enzyme